MGLASSVARTLRELDTLRDLPRNHIVETMDEARARPRWVLPVPSPGPCANSTPCGTCHATILWRPWMRRGRWPSGSWRNRRGPRPGHAPDSSLPGKDAAGLSPTNISGAARCRGRLVDPDSRGGGRRVTPAAPAGAGVLRGRGGRGQLPESRPPPARRPSPRAAGARRWSRPPSSISACPR